MADLDLSNFVLAMPDFSTFAETDVVRKLFSDPKGNVTKAKTKDGSPLPEGVPAFVSSPVTFDEKKVDLDDLLVKLVDFGEGKLTFSVVHSAYPLTPRNTQRSRQLLNSGCTPTLETLLQNSSMGLPPHRARTSGSRSPGSSIAAPSILSLKELLCLLLTRRRAHTKTKLATR